MRKPKKTYILTGAKEDETIFFPREEFDYKKEAIEFAEKKILKKEVKRLTVWNNKTNQIVWYKDK